MGTIQLLPESEPDEHVYWGVAARLLVAMQLDPDKVPAAHVYRTILVGVVALQTAPLKVKLVGQE
jgi:hypothetical protein